MNSEIASWTVLIVDDEPDNIGVAQKILSFYGAQVHIASNGLEGLRILEAIRPTFVLMDLAMPNMDGWGMLREMRANPRTTQIPVIAVTALTMQGDRERVMEAGFDEYIAKPFRLDSFINQIKGCMERLATAEKSDTLLK
jgi:CheY-like chemotaxis protein